MMSAHVLKIRIGSLALALFCGTAAHGQTGAEAFKFNDQGDPNFSDEHTHFKFAMPEVRSPASDPVEDLGDSPYRTYFDYPRYQL
jgi:hypothetical protein